MDMIDFILEGEKKKSALVLSTVCALNKSPEPQKAVKTIEARQRQREIKRDREAEKESCISSLGLWDTRVPQVFQFNESL